MLQKQTKLLCVGVDERNQRTNDNNEGLFRVVKTTSHQPFLFLYLGKTGLAKIIAHLTNSSPFKQRFFNRPIRFPGSNLDSLEINGNLRGSARSKDLTA